MQSNISSDKNDIKLERIIDNQRFIIQNQSIILTSLDTLVREVATGFNKNISIDINNLRQNLSEETIKSFCPVDSLDKLKDFEEKLKIEMFRQSIIDQLSVVCGTSGVKIGIDSCYKLIDHFLTRDFVLQCSWTGNSRAGESKVALKYFINFRKIFLDIVRLTDKTFTEMDCDNFFKRIMKNSTQRLKSKTICSHKNRPTNLTYRRRLNQMDAGSVNIYDIENSSDEDDNYEIVDNVLCDPEKMVLK